MLHLSCKHVIFTSSSGKILHLMCRARLPEFLCLYFRNSAKTLTNSNTSSSMAKAQLPAPCHLLELPPELRNAICGFLYDGSIQLNVIIGDRIFGYAGADFPQPTESVHPDSGSLALLRTCRPIYHEASPVFIDNLPLCLQIGPRTERCLPSFVTFRGFLADWSVLNRSSDWISLSKDCSSTAARSSTCCRRVLDTSSGA